MDVCISQNLLTSYLHTLSAGDGWTIATHPCPPKEDALDTIDKQVLKILEDDGALFSDLSVMLNFNFSSFSIELDFLASQGGLRRCWSWKVKILVQINVPKPDFFFWILHIYYGIRQHQQYFLVKKKKGPQYALGLQQHINAQS